MRRKLLTVFAIASLLLAALPRGAAGAESPFANVVIEVTTTLGPDGGERPFTAWGDAVDEGVVCGSGYTFDGFVKPSPRDGEIPNNYQVFKAFLCGANAPDDPAEDGFVLKLQVRYDQKGNNYSWVAVSGWGDYEDLKGSGSGSGEGYPIIDTFVGKLL